MQGKIIGGYVKKCSEDKKWESSATLFVQVDFPSDLLASSGLCVRSVCCEGKRLPKPLNEMVGKNYFICTNNNFASEFCELK